MTGPDLVLSLLFVLLLALGLWHRRQWLDFRRVQPPPVIDAATEVLAPPQPLAATPKPPDDLVTCRFVTDAGRVLGTTQIPKKARRPTMQYRIRGRMTNFVAGAQDGRVWVYRRVGTDRE